jgi:shikimate kinase
MGAGKTTVGRLLADRLEWTFLDTDSLVEERLGLPVGAVFAKLGEQAFRRAEHAAVTEALKEAETVVSTGGGWPESEGTIESLPAATLSVWLDAPLEELLRRARTQPGARPLLDVPDPVEGARSLLERRAPRYARAQMHLKTAGKDPATVADAIARRVRDQARSERPKTT